MSSGGVNFVQVFNNYFAEFLEDIESVFPDDVDILAAKKAIVQIRKANPKLLVKIWRSFIADKYGAEIAAGNMEFFLQKDYAEDIAGNPNAAHILSAIDRLRNPIRNMGADNQLKTMGYIQNLTTISLQVTA